MKEEKEKKENKYIKFIKDLSNSKRMKVYDVRISDRYYANTKPGTIVGFEKDGIRVVTKDKEVILTDIAIEGKKRCLVKDYLNGIDKKELLGVVLK